MWTPLRVRLWIKVAAVALALILCAPAQAVTVVRGVHPTANGVPYAPGSVMTSVTTSAPWGYLVDGDSHGWRNGFDREGKPGSVFGKTGIIEGWAVDLHQLSGGRYPMLANYATGGHTCKDTWDGRAETKRTFARVIILSCGHNDTLKWVPTATTFYYIRYLTRYHKALGRKVIWLTPPLAMSWGGYGFNSMNARSRIVGEYIRNNSGADYVIDAENLIMITRHLTTDKIHLNQIGGSIIAKDVYSYFRKL